MISVVLYIHNVESHLKRCIESILSQSYSNFEIICVEDYSEDFSKNILKFYENEYNQIKVFYNNSFQGKSFSNKLALNNVNGEYILFLDGDYEFKNNAFEILLSNYKEGVEAIFFKSVNMDFQVDSSKIYNLNKFNHISDDSFMFKCLDYKFHGFFTSSFLNDNSINFYNKNIFFADETHFLDTLYKLNNFKFINDFLFNKTYFEEYNKILDINLFYDLLDIFILNYEIYIDYKFQIWNYLFTKLYKYISSFEDNDIKSFYFKESKVLFDDFYLKYGFQEDIRVYVDDNILDFFNQSVDLIYYIPKKQKIQEKLIKGMFQDLKISIKTPNPIGQRTWGDYFFALSLQKAFIKKGFNVVIHEHGVWYDNDDVDIVIVLRGLGEYLPSKDQINIMWNISHPELISIEEYNKYDVVFISSESYSTEMNAKLDVLVKPLLQCTDPDIFYPKYNSKFSEEILFVGITRNVFRDVVRDISNTNHDFSVYGSGWEDFLNQKYIKGEFIPNNILNQYYSSCKILLNDHWAEMRKLDFPSNRLFDALACGTFIISDKIPSAKTLFEGNIVTYDSVEDLDEKISYYLANDDERKIKSENGRKIVMDKHTFDNRCETIIETLNHLSFRRMDLNK